MFSFNTKWDSLNTYLVRNFSELSLTGIRLNKPVVDGLFHLAKSSSFFALFLGGTCMGAVGEFPLSSPSYSGTSAIKIHKYIFSVNVGRGNEVN